MLELLIGLKALKEQSGMSTDAIVEKSGVSRSTIVRLFQGEGEPRLQNVIDVARVLGAQLILSTDASLKAFNELTVQPFRELMAEKENVIKAITRSSKPRKSQSIDTNSTFKSCKRGRMLTSDRRFTSGSACVYCPSL